jgi:succinoglycan biosynthesis transport protein ExoP
MADRVTTAADEAPGGAGLDLVLAVWRRRKWLAILVFLFPCVVALSLVAAMPRQYESTATILVDRQQVPEEFVRSTVTSAIEVRLQTISQEILSRSRLKELIARFGLYPSLRQSLPEEALIERMRKDIQLELKSADQKGGQRSSTIAFTISYRGGDPQTVAQVTNTVASFYIEENLKARERQATGTAQFLKVQLEETRKRLDQQERVVSEFKKRHLGELPSQMQANLAALQQLSDQLRLNSLNQIRATEKRQLLELQLQSVTPEAVVAGPAGEPVVAQDPRAMRLARLKQEMAELRTRFTDRYPDVQRLGGEIATLEREIAESRDTAPVPPSGKPAPGRVVAPNPEANPVKARIRQAIGEAEAELKVLKDEERKSRAAIATYEQRVANVPRREQEFQEISRDYENTRELYATLTKRFEEAQIAESMEQRQKGEQFRLLDPAVPGTQPAAPKRLQLVAMGLALAFGLAAGAVVLAERLDTSFHSLDDLRAFTTVPVLANIPRLATEADRRQWRRRFAFAGLGTLVGLTLLAGAAWWLAHGNEQLVWFVTRGKV